MFRDMKENSLNAIRTALRPNCEGTAKIPELPAEGALGIPPNAAGSWGGEFVPKPSFVNLHRVRRLDEVATGIEEALRKDYPEYLQLFGIDKLYAVALAFKVFRHKPARGLVYRLFDADYFRLVGPRALTWKLCCG